MSHLPLFLDVGVLLALVVAVIGHDSCEDYSTMCASNVNRCATSFFVQGRCKKTCGLCDSCEDYSTMCASNVNRCATSFFVQGRCKKTCGLCEETESEDKESDPTTLSPDITVRTDGNGSASCEFVSCPPATPVLLRCFSLPVEDECCPTFDSGEGTTPTPPTVAATTIGITPGSTIVTPFTIGVSPVTTTVTPFTIGVSPVTTTVTSFTNGVSPVTTLQSNLLPVQCGSIGERVIGGEELPVRSYIWMALLDYGTRESPHWGCAGSLITERYVVTAAHCADITFNFRQSITRVRLGEHDISKDRDCQQYRTGPLCAPPVQDFSPEEIMIHPNWNKGVRLSNDIALIRLNGIAQLNRYVQPICLPPSDLDIFQFLKGRDAKVAGWGETENCNSSNVKLVVEVPFVDLNTCRLKLLQFNNRTSLLDKGQICFGGKIGKDSCVGDSGGPVVSIDIDAESTNLFVLLGVVSYGSYPCGTDDVPAVYTEVSQYRNWIVSNLRP